MEFGFWAALCSPLIIFGLFIFGTHQEWRDESSSKTINPSSIGSLMNYGVALVAFVIPLAGALAIKASESAGMQTALGFALAVILACVVSGVLGAYLIIKVAVAHSGENSLQIQGGSESETRLIPMAINLFIAGLVICSTYSLVAFLLITTASARAWEPKGESARGELMVSREKLPLGINVDEVFLKWGRPAEILEKGNVLYRTETGELVFCVIDGKVAGIISRSKDHAEHIDC